MDILFGALANFFHSLAGSALQRPDNFQFNISRIGNVLIPDQFSDFAICKINVSNHCHTTAK